MCNKKIFSLSSKDVRLVLKHNRQILSVLQDSGRQNCLRSQAHNNQYCILKSDLDFYEVHVSRNVNLDCVFLSLLSYNIFILYKREEQEK